MAKSGTNPKTLQYIMGHADISVTLNTYTHGKKVISDGALVAITLMIAESRPEEKDIMVALVMNFLTI